MPLYEYDCEACGARFEVIRKFSDPDLDACARCGQGPVRRRVSSPAFQFKGSGWYITDYAQKGKPGGEAPPGEKSGEQTSAPAAESSTTKAEPSKAAPSTGTSKPGE